MPLEPIDEQTGGLCYFSGDDFEKEFPLVSRNRYSIQKYLDDFETIDAFLKQRIQQCYRNAGSFFYFPKTTLHGATKPKTKLRLSINFQIVPKNLFKPKDQILETLFQVVNMNLDACNIFNLYQLGDNIACQRYIDEFGDQENLGHLLLTEFFQDLKHKDLDLTKKPDQGFVHWTKEFA